jgi:hypothetical protein
MTSKPEVGFPIADKSDISPAPEYEAVIDAVCNIGDYSIVLQREAQAKLNLPRSAERVDARSNSDAIHIVASGSRSVDLSRGPS